MGGRDGRTDACMHACMHAWMDGCMDGRLVVTAPVYLKVVVGSAVVVVLVVVAVHMRKNKQSEIRSVFLFCFPFAPKLGVHVCRPAGRSVCRSVIGSVSGSSPWSDGV